MSEQNERLAKATELKAEASLKNKGFVVIRLTRDNGDTYLGEIEVAGPVARAMAKYITGVADYADALAQDKIAENLAGIVKNSLEDSIDRSCTTDEERQFQKALDTLRGMTR
mgnify:FL=1